MILGSTEILRPTEFIERLRLREPNEAQQRVSQDAQEDSSATAAEEAYLGSRTDLPPCHRLLNRIPFEAMFPCLFRDTTVDADPDMDMDGGAHSRLLDTSNP